LHSRSLVHRDLTPLNIYCAPDRPTKLLDFGAMMSAGVAKHLV
jgi:serine/threonine protein kinase